MVKTGFCAATILFLSVALLTNDAEARPGNPGGGRGAQVVKQRGSVSRSFSAPRMTQRPAIHFRSAGSRYQGIKTFKSIKTTNKSFRPAHTSPKLAGSNKGLTPQQLKSGKITTGPTGKLAHATFAPKHAFNAVGGDWWRFRRRFVPGFFFGWVGPVFWPFFYVDLFEYTFWPFYYADYFWAYPYDEIFETIYFIETVPVGPGRGRA